MATVDIIPGNAYLIRGYLKDEQIEKALRNETNKQLVSQLTYSKGWPGRRTKDHKMARFGDKDVTYSYKDLKKPVYPWTASLESVRQLIETDLDMKFNCVVVNYYEPNGDLFPHNDSRYIPELGVNPTIVSLSFGATRTFFLFPFNKKGKIDKTAAIPVELAAGDLFVMHGECDTTYAHGMIPEPEANGSRLSLTFRLHHVIN